jgi:hypothetical protein
LTPLVHKPGISQQRADTLIRQDLARVQRWLDTHHALYASETWNKVLARQQLLRDQVRQLDNIKHFGTPEPDEQTVTAQSSNNR